MTMKLPFPGSSFKTWGDITSTTSWTADRNCYLCFTCIVNDDAGEASVRVNGVRVAGYCDSSVAVGWIFETAHRILIAKGDTVQFTVRGSKNKVAKITAYEIAWK